jgi:acyl-CoA thioesterase FadM
MEGRALQDVLRIHCFGCGALNPQGLQIKSHWNGDDLVCRFEPRPFHIGHPGVVYGGLIASVVDCHSIWTAMATTARDEGLSMEAGSLPFMYVTGKLAVSYRKPAEISAPLELRSRVVGTSGRRSTVQCEVLQGDRVCATAEVEAVRIDAAT